MYNATDIIIIVLIVAGALLLSWHIIYQILPIMVINTRYGSNESNPRTYRVDSEWIPADVWETHLPGWIRTNGQYADVTYADSTGYSDRRLYNVRAGLKYRLNCRNLMDKAQLHRILMASDPDTVCKTIIADETTILPAGTWMVRLNTSTGGRNAVAVDNQKAFNNLRTRWQPKTKYEKEISVIMASEYIINPMLHHGRKFHIRLYMVVGILPSRRAWLINEGLIIPAQLPYKAGNWNNPKIHDTHAKNNPLLEAFTDVLHPEWFDKCYVLMSRVMRVMLTKVDKYNEAYAGYELFGVDIMLTSAGEAKLIEINSLPDISKNSRELNDIICRGLVASAIHHVFPDNISADNTVITELYGADVQ